MRLPNARMLVKLKMGSFLCAVATEILNRSQFLLRISRRQIRNVTLGGGGGGGGVCVWLMA